jgi:predicted deacylase
MSVFTLENISVPAGTKKTGYLPVTNRPDGSMVSIPIIIINGKEDGPTLVISACAHGDEHEGTLALINLSRMLNPEKMKGTVIGVPVLNVDAFHGMRRGNPFDIYIGDMNRIHPGCENGFITERVSHAFFEKVVSRADVLFDLHCGANILYLTELVMFEVSSNKELAKSVGGSWDILWNGTCQPFGSGTSVGACAKLGIPAIVLELGGAGGRFDHFQENIAKIVNGLYNVMKYLNIIEGKPQTAEKYTEVNLLQMPCNHGGIVVPESDFALRNWVKKGKKLMNIIDFFGNTVEEIRAPFDGVITGVRVYPVVHAGEWVVFLGKPV